MLKSALNAIICCTALSFYCLTPLKAQDLDNHDLDFHVTTLTALQEGQASVSLVWNLSIQSPEIDRQLRSILLTKLNAGSAESTASESQDFRAINAVDYMVTATSNHIILTMQSDQETFHLAVDHMAEKLRGDEVDPNWLKRINRTFKHINSSKVRRPENVELELIDYILYGDSNEQISLDKLKNEVLRIPNQIIFNAQNFDFGFAEEVIVDALEYKQSVLAKLPRPTLRSIPKGTIYVADPTASETLVFLVNAQEFETDADQAMADTLYKYMGYGPGSEMFRIVRQEQRASYDPRSHFLQLDNKLVLSGLSATVQSDNWPEIYKVISGIYQTTRDGENTLQGLENSKNSMLNSLIGNLRREPNWLVNRFLELYPERPPQGAITLGLLNESFDIKTSELNENAENVLKPLDKMLSIIIGGEMPPQEMHQNGFCALEIDQPLAFCLTQLSQ